MHSVMSSKEFLAVVQRFTAVQAVGPSAVRGQPKRTLTTIQKYLGRLRLERLADMDCRGYARWLDAHTRQLQARRRKMAWGIARKAINLFMRSCLYNTYLSRKFHLARVQRYMEIPLDSAVARDLKRRAGRGKLPQWPGLIGLDRPMSQQFQDQAGKCAHCGAFQISASECHDHGVCSRVRTNEHAQEHRNHGTHNQLAGEQESPSAGCLALPGRVFLDNYLWLENR